MRDIDLEVSDGHKLAPSTLVSVLPEAPTSPGITSFREEMNKRLRDLRCLCLRRRPFRSPPGWGKQMSQEEVEKPLLSLPLIPVLSILKKSSEMKYFRIRRAFWF